ncbi:MAG TPA: alpha/beta hydrolase [Ktedonobacteraceae bacterium]|nr:alpha/beta hydrolase [Ktedonobacteraceae bacterium]
MAMLTRKAKFPEKAERIVVGKHHLYYRTVGSGTPLVLIHGYGVSGQIWQRTLPYLAQQHQVFIVDLPGYGHSPATRVWHLREMAPLLATWLRQLQLSSVAVTGHSMGGAIAIHLTANAPELVSRLILVNAAGIPLRARLPSLAARSLHSFFQIGNGHLPLGLVRDILQPRLNLLWQTAQEMKRSDFREELAQISTPTLIIWGERDVMLPIALGHALKDALPHATFVTMPHCGHRPMLAQPAQFSKLVLEFIAT